MDLTKTYYDSDDEPRNILQMVKREPEWAANRIQVDADELRKLVMVINSYLREEDGTNLIPNHVRVRNMLKRLAGEQNTR